MPADTPDHLSRDRVRARAFSLDRKPRLGRPGRHSLTGARPPLRIVRSRGTLRCSPLGKPPGTTQHGSGDRDGRQHKHRREHDDEDGSFGITRNDDANSLPGGKNRPLLPGGVGQLCSNAGDLLNGGRRDWSLRNLLGSTRGQCCRGKRPRSPKGNGEQQG